MNPDCGLLTRHLLGAGHRVIATDADDERHVNVLIDTALVPDPLAEEGVDATVASAFGTETLPAGLVAVAGRRVRAG